MDRGYSTHSRDFMSDGMGRGDKPVLQQIKKAYWTTKQQIIKTIGKKQDQHIVASDAELDSKLALFREIAVSCESLRRVILIYHKQLTVLAREENLMGKFLKNQGEDDLTRAGSMMCSVGKSQCFNAAQRIQLRSPLQRLYQEVETFQKRAVVDTNITVVKMEDARTEYRAALLWMKDISEKLDPDAYNRLEKFRTVQSEVRKAKEKFDKRKLDVLQKVDMLAASRSNMYSHVLANYQNQLVDFWKKTSRVMNAVSETFEGFQYYEFNMLKDLDEATRELADQTCSEKSQKLVESLLTDSGESPPNEEDKLIYDIIMSLKDKKKTINSTTNNQNERPQEAGGDNNKRELTRKLSADSTTGLIDFDVEDFEQDEQFGDFQAAFPKQDDFFDSLTDEKDGSSSIDPLDDLFGPPENTTTEKPAASVGGGGFLPADLLDTSDISALLLQGQENQVAEKLAAMNTKPDNNSDRSSKENKNAQSKTTESKPMSAWYDLFADLDPLQDPDSVGKSQRQLDGGCA